MDYTPNRFGQIIEYVDADALRDFNEEIYGEVLGVERIAIGDQFIGLEYSVHFVILDRYDQIKAGTEGFSDDDALMSFVRNWQHVMDDYGADDDEEEYMVYVGPAS